MRSSDHRDPAQKSGKGRRLFAVCGLLSLPGLYLYFILQMLFGRNTSGEALASLLGAMVGLPILLFLMAFALHCMRKRQDESRIENAGENFDEKKFTK